MYDTVAEWQRLGLSLEQPVDHFKRRTSDVALTDDRRLDVEVSLEIKIATLAGDSQTTAEAGQRLVSLGLFDKAHQLPDLRASQPTGRQIAVLSRDDRSRALAWLFAARFFEVGGKQGRTSVYGLDNLDKGQFRAVLALLRRVVGLPPGRAAKVREVLEESLNSMGMSGLSGNREFQEALDSIVHFTHLLAVVEARPNDLIAINTRYSQPIRAIRARRDHALGDRQPRRRFQFARTVLRWIGLLPYAASLGEPSADHYESVHLLFHAPEGGALEDVYWESLKDAETRPRGDYPEFQKGDFVWLSTRFDEPAINRPPMAWFGVRGIRPSVAVTGAALSALIAVILHRLAVEPRSLENLSARALLLALPGLLAGALAQTKPSSVAGPGRGPRLLLLAIAATPLLVAGANLFGIPEDLASVEAATRISAGTTTGAAVLFVAMWAMPKVPLPGRLPDNGPAYKARRRYYRWRDVLAAAFLSCAVVAGAAVYGASAPGDTSETETPAPLPD